MIGAIIGVGVPATIGLIGISWWIGTYNGFQVGNTEIKEQFGNIRAEYQRRVDMFINLANTVKSFKNHEKATLTEIAKARNPNYWNCSKKESMKKMGKLESAFSRLMMQTEQYPQLVSADHHSNLMEEIRITEDRINIARTDYNALVSDYNKLVLTFPSCIVASKHNFTEEIFFEGEEGIEKAPKISL